MSDVIKNPAHYCFGKFEPKDVIRDWGLNFNLGNAVKYIARAGRKDDIVQDLKKARQYLDFEIDALEQERAEEKKKEPGKAETPTHSNCRCQVVFCKEPETEEDKLAREHIEAMVRDIFGGAE